MLKKLEEKVLKIINDNAFEGNTCLISKSSLVAFINEKLVDENTIDNLINSLSASDYIDYIVTSRKGEIFYCITLLKKGKNYKEVKKREVGAIKNRILLAIVGAVVSFVVGRILLILFK